MAQVIVEQREFTNRETGIVTVYDYFAVKGRGGDGHEYEVALKNMVQSEKQVLKMIANGENTSGDIVSRKANEDEQPKVSKGSDKINLDEDDEVNSGLFD